MSATINARLFRLALVFAFPLLCAFAVYWPALPIDYIGDDVGRIFANHVFLGNYFSAVKHIMPDRPLLSASLWLNFLASGTSIAGMRTGNLLLHAGACAAILALWARVASIELLSSRILVPLALVALFAVHPANSQAVTHVIQRGVMAAALFSALAMIQGIKWVDEGQQRQSALLCALFYLAAMLFKPNSAIVPCIIALYAGLNYRPGLARKSPLLAALLVGVTLLPPLMMLALRENLQTRALTPLAYFGVQLDVWLLYAKLWAYPKDLRFLYDIAVPAKALNSHSIALFCAYAVFLAVATFALRERFRPALFFLWAAVISLLPESSFFPIDHLAFEHRTYFPAAMALGALASLWAGSRLDARKAYHGAALACAAAALLFYSSGTRTRIAEINTVEKWFANTLKYRHDDHQGNLSFLDYFWQFPTAARIEIGLRESERFAKLYPDIPEYGTFVELFRYAKIPAADRKLEDLDKVVRFMFGKSYKTAFLATFLLEIHQMLQKFLRPPFSDQRYEKLAVAAIPLLFLASERTPLIEDAIRDYNILLNTLDNSFRRKKMTMSLPIDEQVQWMRVRLARWIFFERYEEQAAGAPYEVFGRELRSLRKKYPRRKDIEFLADWLELDHRRKANPAPEAAAELMAKAQSQTEPVKESHGR
ncbi:MAG: hypothetical protein HY075_00365 [Deltaproteobacteria bacterium]|nr:hypothetical protein [Deltaproteobacteria bacterium]